MPTIAVYSAAGCFAYDSNVSEKMVCNSNSAVLPVFDSVIAAVIEFDSRVVAYTAVARLSIDSEHREAWNAAPSRYRSFRVFGIRWGQDTLPAPLPER